MKWRSSQAVGARTVYSTDKGRICPGCGWPADKCACSRPVATPAKGGPVRVLRETKGRKGKGVTLVTGLGLPDEEMAALGRELRQRCGSGGTVKNGAIEIQGDHRDQVVVLLGAKGIKAKKAGG